MGKRKVFYEEVSGNVRKMPSFALVDSDNFDDASECAEALAAAIAKKNGWDEWKIYCEKNSCTGQYQHRIVLGTDTAQGMCIGGETTVIL